MSGPRRKKAPKGFKSQKKPDVIDQDEAWLQQQMQEQQGASIYNNTYIMQLAACVQDELSYHTFKCGRFSRTLSSASSVMVTVHVRDIFGLCSNPKDSNFGQPSSIAIAPSTVTSVLHRPIVTSSGYQPCARKSKLASDTAVPENDMLLPIDLPSEQFRSNAQTPTSVTFGQSPTTTVY